MERYGRKDCAVIANTYDTSKTISTNDIHSVGPSKQAGSEYSKLQIEASEQHNDQSLPAELAHLPFVSRDNCTYFVEPGDFYNHIRDQFPSYEDTHGVLHDRVLIWGPEGNGKRQFATYFARKFAPPRHILWIDGSHSATFVRDFCLAYQIVTKSPAPRGVNLTWLLLNIQKTLTKRRKQWFMVILDLTSRLSNANANETGLNLASYLPYGQILITTSRTLVSDGDTLEGPDYCGNVKVPNLSSTLYLSSWSKEFCLACHRAASSSNSDFITSTKSVRQDFSNHLFSLSLACGAARLAGTSFTHIIKLLDRRMAEVQQLPIMKGAPINLRLRFHCVLELFLEFLRDTNSDAETLLFAIIAVDNQDVPVSLLKRLPMLQDGIDDALELLESTSIVHVRKFANGERYVTMHRITYSWFILKAREIVTDGDSELLHAIASQWVDVLNEYVPDVVDDSCREICWLRLHLVLSLFDISRAMNICSLPLVSLLRKIGSFLNESLVMPMCTTRILARAQNVCALLQQATPSSELDVLSIHLHRERSKLASLLAETSRAFNELVEAKKVLDTLTVPSTLVEELRQSLFDEEVTQLLRQDRTQIVAPMVLDELMCRSELDTIARRAQLHAWYACSATLVPNEMPRSLQHSHLALSYWNSLPEDEKWGSKNFSQLAWVDTHAGLLMQMDKSRGALVFLPRLLQSNIDHCPITHHNIWRLAYCTVREYVYSFEYEEAERVACHILSLCEKGVATLSGVTLTWAILMLHILGANFRCMNRFVEAEGVFRWCLESIEEREPPGVANEAKHFSPSLWTELLHVLLAQGKFEEAKAAREIALEKGCEQLREIQWLEETAKLQTKEIADRYDRILQAARDRVAKVHNPDDGLLEITRPHDFTMAIRYFGDPLERVEYHDEDFRTDLRPVHLCSGADSKILDLLDFEWSDRVSGKFEVDKDEENMTNWTKVFDGELNTVDVRTQSRLWNYWRWCDCRRKRSRSPGSATTIAADRKRSHEMEAKTRKIYPVHQQRPQQSSMYSYVTRDMKYDPKTCSPSCPCIKANLEGKNLTKELEAARLYQYKSPDTATNEAHQQQYLRDLQRYRRKFGPRPALPYGMFFQPSWQNKSLVADGKKKKKRVHELLWVSDYILRGDNKSTTSSYLRDENYLLTNPAMRMSKIFDQTQVYDLPDICITASESGEFVRQNILKKASPKPSHLLQLHIREYFRPLKRRPTASVSVRSRSASPMYERRRLVRGGLITIRGYGKAGEVCREETVINERRSRSAGRGSSIRTAGSISRSNSGSRSRSRSKSKSKSRSKSRSRSRSGSAYSSKSPIRRRAPSKDSSRSREDVPSRSISPVKRGRSHRDRTHSPRSSISCSPSTTSRNGGEVDLLQETKGSTRDKTKQNKLKIFNINSIHSQGPIFDWGPFSMMKLRGWQQRVIPFPYHDSDEETPSEADNDFYKVPRVLKGKSRFRSKSRSESRSRSRSDSRSISRSRSRDRRGRWPHRRRHRQKRRRPEPFSRREYSPRNEQNSLKTDGYKDLESDTRLYKGKPKSDEIKKAYKALKIPEMDIFYHEPHRCDNIIETNEELVDEIVFEQQSHSQQGLDLIKHDEGSNGKLPEADAEPSDELHRSIRSDAKDAPASTTTKNEMNIVILKLPQPSITYSQNQPFMGTDANTQVSNTIPSITNHITEKSDLLINKNNEPTTEHDHGIMSYEDEGKGKGKARAE